MYSRKQKISNTLLDFEILVKNRFVLRSLSENYPNILINLIYLFWRVFEYFPIRLHLMTSFLKILGTLHIYLSSLFVYPLSRTGISPISQVYSLVYRNQELKICYYYWVLSPLTDPKSGPHSTFTQIASQF